ncbi:uncharacterized protein LOC123318372 [Coccinella septempunctata]|uniref:uncharacterized protein LOC123318372 n=1 Tax=Coccinella septempunctata TaxID=41139 RepID=UPI001D0635C1|nr:uncharacterized protein LOC123318372 [Coccinella septempunctata]
MEDIKIADSSWSHYIKDKQNLVFIPNVAKQRYTIVHELLTHSKWRDQISSVTEYGCAGYKFFPFLKNTPSIKQINFIDIDEYLLEQRLFFIRPLLYDHMNERANPLEVKVFEGSISDPDWRILNSDAVVGIEIIEHLFPDTLDAVPYVIFNTIKPKIVIFTTPNADFNVALPNFHKFRHPDHKFEWTREQFQSWASNITLRFPQYKVSFFGVGRGPRGTSDLGYCSQLALFIRTDMIGFPYDTSPCFCEGAKLRKNGDQCSDCNPLQAHGICTYLTKSKEFQCTNGNEFYRLLEKAVYPHKRNDKKTKEEHILESLKYKIYNGFFQYTNEDGVDEIPLYSITRTYEGQNITEEEIKDVLILHGYKIKNCLVKNCNGEGNDDWAPCVLYQRPQTPSTDSETHSYEDENQRLSPETPLSDWDDDTATAPKGDCSKGISRIPKSTKKMDGNKKHAKGLVESGLGKTISITGTSQPVAKDATDKVIGSCMSLKESTLRKQLKAVILSDCKFEPLFSTETLLKDQKTVNRPLPDPNKVNELDCLNNRNQSRPYPLSKTFFSQIMRTQFKITSRRSPRKTFRERTTASKSTKRKSRKPLSDSEDDALGHIKSIANCLLENTLNKLDIKESSKLIADHIDDPVVQTPESSTSSSSNFQIMDLPSSSTDQDGSGSSGSNDTSQDTVVDVRKKGFDTNNSVTSREALYDPNSRVDLLEDFDISPLLDGFGSVQTISVGAPANNVVFLGMRPLNEDDSAQPDGNVFPGWLLRILRNNFPDNNQDNSNEWAYFYSQGDGWGNNTPWIIRNNDDESEDASSEASSTNDSSIAEADNRSSFQDIISLPDDSLATHSERNHRQIEHQRLHNEDSEEYFDTLDNIGAAP